MAGLIPPTIDGEATSLPSTQITPKAAIIAMDAKPTRHIILDYGMRWGIENMLSDFKSCGFGLMQSQIQKADRIERLILVMSIALY